MRSLQRLASVAGFVVGSSIALLTGAQAATLGFGSSGSSSSTPCTSDLGGCAPTPGSTGAAPASASTIDTNNLTPVATVNTRGQYDLAGLGTWNGQPLSPTNMPTPDQSQLSATWNFFVDPHAVNTLYITVSNVLDPNFGNITGPPFHLTALTGFQFTLPVASPSYASLSNQFAVPGQTVVGPMYGESAPLTTTPGWHISSISGPPKDATYVLASGDVPTTYAFTHFSSVRGDLRILNGGVFQFVFDPSVDLFNADFADLSASASNGMGAYFQSGTLIFPTPSEIPLPPAIYLFGSVLGGPFWLGRRKRSAVSNLGSA